MSKLSFSVFKIYAEKTKEFIVNSISTHENKSIHITSAERTKWNKDITDTSTNASNIATNTSNIATNTANIATNAANIATNTADLTTLKGTSAGSVKKTVADAIAAVVASAPESLDTLKEIADWISTHGSDAAAMNTQINTNKTNIATNASNISKNATDIATNKTNIATNTSNIAKNANDIAKNATDIATNKANIATNTNNIATNTNNIATNTANIATHATLIADNASKAASNMNAVAAINRKMGGTDLTGLGDGTVTGAIRQISTTSQLTNYLTVVGTKLVVKMNETT